MGGGEKMSTVFKKKINLVNKIYKQDGSQKLTSSYIIYIIPNKRTQIKRKTYFFFTKQIYTVYSLLSMLTYAKNNLRLFKFGKAPSKRSTPTFFTRFCRLWVFHLLIQNNSILWLLLCNIILRTMVVFNHNITGTTRTEVVIRVTASTLAYRVASLVVDWINIDACQTDSDGFCFLVCDIVYVAYDGWPETQTVSITRIYDNRVAETITLEWHQLYTS